MGTYSVKIKGQKIGLGEYIKDIESKLKHNNISYKIVFDSNSLQGELEQEGQKVGKDAKRGTRQDIKRGIKQRENNKDIIQVANTSINKTSTDKSESNNKDNNSIRETIIDIASGNIEIVFEDSIATYIKLRSSVDNEIYEITLGERIDVHQIHEITQIICHRYDISEEDIRISKMRLSNADIIFLVKDNGNIIRIHLISDLSGKVYSSTIKYIGKYEES